MMYSREELAKLVNAYGDLPEEKQRSEMVIKMRSMIRSLRLINHEENLDVPEANIENKGLSEIFYLLYCLEDEAAKIVDKMI